MEKQIGKAVALLNDRKKTALLILLCASLISTAIALYHMTEKEVHIVEQNIERNITTRKNTVAELLDEQNISIKPEDIVKPSMEASVEDGLTIEIKRAVPITITADGKEHEIITAKTNVGEIIKDSGLKLGDIDKVIPSKTSDIDKDKNIQIVRIKEEKISEETKISYSRQNNPSKNLDKGETKLVQEGEDGLKERELKITYEDGKESKRETIKEEVVIEPMDEIMQVGINDTISTSRGNTRFESSMTVTATAYCEDDPGVNGTTSVGAPLQRGVIAVDPNVIPYYTKIYVPGYGFGQALDTGGAIRGNKIDLAMASKSQALQYGRQTVKIYILED